MSAVACRGFCQAPAVVSQRMQAVAVVTSCAWPPPEARDQQHVSLLNFGALMDIPGASLPSLE